MVDQNRLLSILLGFGLVSLLLVPIQYSQAQTFECGGDFTILQGSDDAEEFNDGDMRLNDVLDLDLAEEHVGVRFQQVTVPQGSIITRAFIQFTSEQDDQELNQNAAVDIFAENVDNSQTFSNSNFDITNRDRTISKEFWVIPQWPETGENSGPDQKTPDLSSLVQEVVERTGWSNLNAMSFIFIRNNLDGSNDVDRDVQTFENNPNNAAVLHIECFDPSIDQCRDVLLNFDGLPHGARLGNPDGSEQRTIHWKLAPFGIEASAIAHEPDDPPGRGLDTLIVYDSHFSQPSSTSNPDSFDNVGQDPDLEHPFNPNADPLVEGIPIIPTTAELCDEKPSILTMTYTGDNNPTSHSQDAGKVNVLGTTGNDPEVFIIASSKADPSDSTAKIFFTGTVTLGSTFEIDSNNAGSTKLESKTFVLVYSDSTQTTLLQSVEFHTSCSQPLFIGDQFGSVQLIGFVDINGVVTDPSVPFASPNDWKNGGTVVYTFVQERILKKFTGVDDLNTVQSVARVFLSDGSQIDIPINRNDDNRGTHVYDIVDISGVERVEFFYPSSGGITNIDLGCVPPPVCGDRPPPDTSGLSPNQVLGITCIEPIIPFCGDGSLNQPNEQCDDGNNVNGDGCDANCQLESECTGVTSLTVEFEANSFPVTITVTGKVGGQTQTLKQVTFDGPPVILTITKDDVQGRDRLPNNSVFNIMGTPDIEIPIHTSCSQPIDVDDMFDGLTIIALCKIFGTFEQCFVSTNQPYTMSNAELNVEGSNNNQPLQMSSRNNDDPYTEPPDHILTPIGEGALAIGEGELTPPEDIPGIVEQFLKYDALDKEYQDMLAKLQQKGVKLDKRLQSLLEKYENGKYYGPIPEGDQVTKSYSFSLDGSAFSIRDSTETDFSGEIFIETLWTGTHSSKFRVTGGQLIIGDISYDVIFGKARTTFSTYSDKDSMVILAQLLDQEGNVNTLRLSFNSQVSLQEEPSQSINFEIAPRSKIAHNWHLSASGQLSLLEG